MKRNNAKRGRIEHSRRNKKNPLKAAGIEKVDYKDTTTLRQFISDRHKIRSRRVTGLTPKQQRPRRREERARDGAPAVHQPLNQH